MKSGHDANMARVAECATPDALLTVVAEHGDTFSPVNTSAAMHKYARLAPSKVPLAAAPEAVLDPRLARLLALADDQVATMRPRNLANTLWAFATLGRRPTDSFLATWQRAATESMSRFEAQHVSNSLWAMATLDIAVDEQFASAVIDAVVRHAVSGVLLGQHVSICLWALAVLQLHPGDAAVDALTAAATVVLDSCNSQHVSNVLYGLARLCPGQGQRHASMLTALAEHSRPRLSSFKQQELSACLWSCAALDWSPGTDWLRAHEVVWRDRLHTASPQSLSTALLAWSKLRHMPLRLQWYGTCLRARLHEASPQAVANALCAFGTFFTAARHEAATPREDAAAMEHAAPSMDVLDALASHVISHIQEFNPGEITQTLWGFATLGYDPGMRWRATLATVTAGDNSSTHLRRFAPAELSSSLWAFATLGVSPGLAWLEHWERAAESQWPQFEARHAVNVAWAAVVLQPLSCSQGAEVLSRLSSRAWEHARHLLAAASQTADSDLLPHAGWCALYQAALVACAEQHAHTAESASDEGASTGIACDALLTPGGAARAAAAWRAQTKVTRTSGLQRDVSHVLFAGLGVPHTLEKRLPGGLASVDIAIEPPMGGRVLRIALEADGPRHFLRNRPRQPKGSTLLRNRLLAALGWRVVVVPYFDWPQDDFDARVTLLHDLLTPACPWLKPSHTRK